MPEADLDTKTDKPEETEVRPELTFDDGEIAPYIASPYEDAQISDELKAQIKALVDLVGNKDIAARRWEVEECWQARLFKRGYQYLLPRKGGGWIYPPLATDYSRTGRSGGRNFYGYETNIYTTCEEIIISALTRDVPRTQFRPMNPSCDADVTAADAATRYSKIFGRTNNLRKLQTQLASYLWTDGRALIVTDHVLDAQRFGRQEPDEEPVVPETETEESQYSLYAMRHGETELNRDDRMRGRSDSNLDEKGERQVGRAAEWMKNKNIELIVSSPVERSLESAREVSRMLGIPLEVDDRLASLDIGDATGLKISDSDETIEGFFEKPDEKIPGSSESPNEFDQRVISVMQEYLPRGGTLFVTHDSVILSMFRQLRGGDLPPSSLVPPGGVAGLRQASDGVPEIVSLYPSAKPEGSTGQTRGAPRGEEIATVYGKLEHRVPMGSQLISEMPFVMVAFELDVADSKARYPKYSEKIKPGGGVSGENELDRIARINCQLALQASYVTGDSMVRDSTNQYIWFRPAFFMEVKDAGQREELFEKFPDGLKVTLASDIIVGCRNECMDDHLTLIHASPGSGQNRLALGGKLISIQKRLNTWVDLLDAYFVRTIPGTYVPEPIFDVKALAAGPRAPGDYTPYQFSQVPEGRSIKDLIQTEELPLNNPAMPQMIMYFIENLPQYLVHAMPSLFGSESNTDTYRGIAIQRDQALAASSTPWGHIQEATASYFRQAVQLAGQCRTGAIDGMDESGNAIRIELADLKGKVLAYPETDANFPESWIQKQSRYEQMIITATTNPFMAGILSSPQNARLAKDMAGFSELMVPGADAYEKQMGELDVLLKTGPLPNPVFQQLQEGSMELKAQIEARQAQGAVVPPEAIAQLKQMQQQMETTPQWVSTVPVDKKTDNHPVERQACLDLINSERGRRMKNGTAEDREHFKNVHVHFEEHDALVPPPQPQTKPPSMSINYKDLPPEPAAKLLTDAGLETTGADVVQTKEFNAEIKRSSKIGGPPIPGIGEA